MWRGLRPAAGVATRPPAPRAGPLAAPRRSAPGSFALSRRQAGRWFDPDLVAALADACRPAFRETLAADDVSAAFAWIIDAKSSYTFEPSDRVCDVAARVATRLGFSASALTRLRRAALLHDLGKLAVPNAILDKPGALTPEEWDVVRRHLYHTSQILRCVPVFAELADVAANHHERLDGGGYFRGLDGAHLTMTARVLAVADVADALMSARPYRAAMPIDRVLAIIEGDAGTAFCPDCVVALREVLVERAAGTLAPAV